MAATPLHLLPRRNPQQELLIARRTEQMSDKSDGSTVTARPLLAAEFETAVLDRVEVHTVTTPVAGLEPVEIHRETVFGNPFPVESAQADTDAARRGLVVDAISEIYDSLGEAQRIWELCDGNGSASFAGTARS